MKKRRQLLYILCAIATFVMLYNTGNRFLLFVFLLEILLPIGTYLKLKKEMDSFRIQYDVRSACVRGMNADIRVTLRQKRKNIVSSSILLDMDYDNRLFGVTEKQQIVIPLLHKKKRKLTYTVPYCPSICGKVIIRTPKIVVRDVFGLFQLEMEPISEKILMVYPVSISMTMSRQEDRYSLILGEENRENKMGNDTSEIFELKEYVPGDDIRKVHWKLSSKLEDMMVKQGSDTTNFRTLLLFDAGLYTEDVMNTKEMLCAAIEFAMSLSNLLIKNNVSHHVAVPVGGKLYLMEVGSTDQYNQMIDSVISMELPRKSGQGILFFESENQKQQYSKVLYVTAGGFASGVFRMTKENYLSAINIMPANEARKVTEQENSLFLEIPENQVYEKEQDISI